MERYVAFCPYRIDGRLSGADKILFARALLSIPPEMSIEESSGAIPITLLFCLLPLSKWLETLAEDQDRSNISSHCCPSI